MKKPMVDTMMREKFDNLYTPREAILPLIKYLPYSAWKIWEPCDPGHSKISEELEKAGRLVLGTDIESGTDFLNSINTTWPFDMIITNPPYSLKDKFIERCYFYKKPFALLLPLTALEGIKRGKMFREKGISVIVLDKRIDFTGKGANWFNVSWFTYGIFPENTIVFEEV